MFIQPRRAITNDGKTSFRWYLRRSFSNYFASREWAEIALIVANQYPGSDYFEFGSEGFRTFRNFLSAFHLNGHTEKMPEVKFYAFDIFGEPKSTSSLTETERPYFEVYRRLGEDYYRAAEGRLRHHGLLLDRCVIVKRDTLKTRSVKNSRRSCAPKIVVSALRFSIATSRRHIKPVSTSCRSLCGRIALLSIWTNIFKSMGSPISLMIFAWP